MSGQVKDAVRRSGRRHELGGTAAKLAGSLLAGLLALTLLFPAAGKAVTVGAPLGLSANAGNSCQGFVLVGVPPSCTIFGVDTAGAWTSQTPRGNWVITRARVRTGPSVGPMTFTVIRVLRSQAGSPPTGAICCTVPFESPVFVPAPNAVNEVPVNLPAVNTVEVVDGEPIEVVDYLGISMLDLSSSLPMHVATSAVDPEASASLSYFIPAMRAGQQALQAGGQAAMTPLVNGDYQPARAGTPPRAGPPVAVPPPPVPTPFRLLPGFTLLPGGTRARLGVDAPGPGLLRAFAPRRGGARVSKGSKRRPGRLLVPTKRRVKKAGKAYIAIKLGRAGKARLRMRGKLTVRVKLTFRPSGGKALTRTRRVTFRKPHNSKKAKAGGRSAG